MKFSPCLNKSVRIAAPVLFAFLLSIVLLPGAALATPPGPLPGDDNTQQSPPPPPSSSVPPPPSSGVQPPPSNAGPPPPPSNPAPTPTPAPVPDSTPAPHPSAPNTPPADCIVAHAATPTQLCPISGGLQYYFIGADGSSQAGPYIQPFSELATLHTGVVSLYSSTNPFTSKSVQIHYLPTEGKIRISTYYPDTMYDTDKPYTFTVNSSNSVSHEAW